MTPFTVAVDRRLESRFWNVEYIFYNKFIQQICFEYQYSSDKKEKKEGEERRRTKRRRRRRRREESCSGGQKELIYKPTVRPHLFLTDCEENSAQWLPHR
jgi:hypothetical protein